MMTCISLKKHKAKRESMQIWTNTSLDSMNRDLLTGDGKVTCFYTKSKIIWANRKIQCRRHIGVYDL